MSNLTLWHIVIDGPLCGAPYNRRHGYSTLRKYSVWNVYRNTIELWCDVCVILAMTLEEAEK